ncbi:hypothetical protein TEA_006810 [Camellia sinensis var. sinensis]|uniref:Uncharacterized protein n=1 Tax=Camellia sinensis var. sinensis TaxID=542762 RepID=A0A4S4EG29_CAMSN|nr:hypothetical protein TEA_006810 [Camellia sinensis var. sinensis]
MKKMCGSTSDIITRLPDNVKETILMSLPLQDAVRTSISSRKWRYTWARLPQLVFDDKFCRESIRNQKNELIKTIYQEFKLHIRKGEPYKLPSSLFSGLQLKDLTLRSGMFKPPPEEFKGFRSLLRLELCKVAITANIFSSLISSCPLLEELTLEDCSSLDCLEIYVPNLIFLFYESHVRSICFKNTPHPAKVSINLKVYTNGETLKEGEASNMVGIIPFSFFQVFNDDPVLELLEAQDWSDISLNQLPGVEMKNVLGMTSELEFIRLLLAKSPMLEIVLIEPNLEKVADKGLRILKALTRFWRLSPQVEITYNGLDGNL